MSDSRLLDSHKLTLTELQLGQSTMDNAGTNNTHMDHFEHLLEADNIQYDADGNRIRYLLVSIFSFLFTDLS